MPVFVDTQKKDFIRQCKKEYIDRDLLECYNRIVENQNVSTIVRSHKACIHRTNLLGKNKYKTLRLLEHYKNSKNKRVALANLTSSLNNRGLFSMFLSDGERKNSQWNAKGTGQKC